MHTLAYVRDTAMPVSMITTIEDDNVGFFPQLTTQSLHKIVRAMREYDLEGLLVPAVRHQRARGVMHYMIRAAWDAEATPESTYRDFARRVGGEEAVESAADGLPRRGGAGSGVERHGGRRFPHALPVCHYWKSSGPPEELCALAARMRGYAERVASLLPVAAELLARAAPRGKGWAERYRLFLRFATEYPLMLAALLDADARICRGELRAEKQFLAFCRQDR